VERRAIRTFVTGTMLAASLAACGKKDRLKDLPPPPEAPPTQTPAPSIEKSKDPLPDLSPDQRLARVVALLNAGDEPTARVELAELLRQQPGRREALVLQQSIEGDPRALLPSDSFAYVIQPGDTYITLALEYLEDSYKFYALARVNGVSAAELKPGVTIQIPGRFRTPRRQRPETPRPAPSRPSRPAAGPAPAVQPVAPRTNPAAAQRYRRSGLEALSAGRTDLAVRRLEQAARADPGNTAIQSDLTRARRVQSTVRGR